MTQLEGNMKKLGDVEMEIRSLTRSTQHSKMKVKFGIPDPICDNTGAHCYWKVHPNWFAV